MRDAEPIFPILYQPDPEGEDMAILRSRSGHYLPVCDGRYAWLIDPADGQATQAVARATLEDAEEFLLEDPGTDPTRPELVVVWAHSAPLAAELFADGITGMDSL